MKRVALVCGMLLAALALQAKNSYVSMSYEALPERARLFVSNYFPNIEVKSVGQKVDDGMTEYKVVLKDKTNIEFDMVGAWDKVRVDKKKGTMPRYVCPVKAQETLDKDYAGKSIVEVENDGFYYEVHFSDGTELTVDAVGHIIELEVK